MNTDIRLSVDFLAHHKTRKLRRRLGADAILSLIDIFCYAAKVRPDGNLQGMDTDDIADIGNWNGESQELVSTLCELGFLEQCEEGVYFIHDWDEHNPWVAGAQDRKDAASKAGKASAAKRAAKKDEQSQPDFNGCSTEGQRAVENRCERSATPFPLPSPFPSPEEEESTLTGTCRQPAADQPDAADVDGEDNTPHEPAQPSPSRPALGSQKKPQQDTCPHSEIVELYHEVLPELPRVKAWNEKRRKLLRSRWKERPERQNLDFWRRYFEYVRKSPFLMGQRASPGRSPFVCTLEWLVTPSNFTHVIEEKYHREQQ